MALKTKLTSTSHTEAERGKETENRATCWILLPCSSLLLVHNVQ